MNGGGEVEDILDIVPTSTDPTKCTNRKEPREIPKQSQQNRRWRFSSTWVLFVGSGSGVRQAQRYRFISVGTRWLCVRLSLGSRDGKKPGWDASGIGWIRHGGTSDEPRDVWFLSWEFREDEDSLWEWSPPTLGSGGPQRDVSRGSEARADDLRDAGGQVSISESRVRGKDWWDGGRVLGVRQHRRYLRKLGSVGGGGRGRD